MEPKSHKQRNIIILVVIIILIILLLSGKKDFGLNIGSGRLSDEEKALLMEKLSNQSNFDSGANLSETEKKSIIQNIQKTNNSGSINLSEEQKLQIIKETR